MGRDPQLLWEMSGHDGIRPAVPRRVLVAYTSRPPTIGYLKAAFARQGIEARGFLADENTRFDRLVIRPVTKLAHNLRFMPKSRKFLEEHPWAHFNYRSRRLREEIAAYDPDLLLLIRGLGFHRAATEKARTAFGWWVEADERLDEALGEVPWFDGYFFINFVGVEAARQAGHPHVHYLPHAADPLVFRPLPGIRRDIDFSFVGVWSKKRQEYMEAALEVSPNGAIYGSKWYAKTFADRRFRRIVKGRYIGGESLVRLYNRTKVVLNVTNWGSGGGRSGMTMRLFEVPACGSFLLTDHSLEIAQVITPGEHLETFSDLDEFRQKLRRYLALDAERERIAAQGRAHVAAHCTYDRTVARICEVYSELRRANAT
jgi:spore maturation protein CgeB